MVPVEVGMPTYRIQPSSNDKRLEEQLNLLEEKREEVEIWMAINKQKLEHYFNRRVKPKSFKVVNLVLKESETTTHEEGKLGWRWEGPFALISNNRPGSYCLKDI